MSVAGLNGRDFAPGGIASSIKWMRLRSASMRIKRGTSVSAASSSAVQIKAFPAVARVPSGHAPPAEIVAAKESAIVVLPVSGTPARMWSLPRARKYFQAQEIGSGETSLARRVTTCGDGRNARPPGGAALIASLNRPTSIPCRGAPASAAWPFADRGRAGVAFSGRNLASRSRCRRIISILRRRVPATFPHGSHIRHGSDGRATRTRPIRERRCWPTEMRHSVLRGSLAD